MEKDVSFRNPAERRISRVAHDLKLATPLSAADDAVEVVPVRLDAELAAANDLALCLSDAERARADRFVFERDRRRFIVGRARLRELLASRLGTRPDLIELEYGPRGKPRLAGDLAESDLRFNLSHCGDVALYSFSRGREIGVDVEAVRDVPDADDIVEHFFSQRERAVYRRLPAHERLSGFFRCWTRKEAFIKALGSGLAYPLTEFDSTPAPKGWSLRSFVPGPGMIGALAVSTE